LKKIDRQIDRKKLGGRDDFKDYFQG
jgi:hypothetical protein